MSESVSSGAKTALENQRIGALQIGVVAICTLIQMCDGYDVGSIGWAVPSLTHAWNLQAVAYSDMMKTKVAVLEKQVEHLTEQLNQKPSQ